MWDLGELTARVRIAEHEVESVLRKSHSSQFDWLQDRFEIKLTENLASWPTFIELTERRNLFVHTKGIVSSNYISVCRKNSFDTKEVNVGDTLDATPEYLVSSYKCLYEIGVKLSQVFWRKLVPTEIASADKSLNMIAYELLTDEKYELATRLLEFAVNTLKRHGSEKNKKMFIVNLAQAYKFSGLEDDCRTLLNATDWSACSDDFSICLSVLKDEFETASNLMKKFGAGGEMTEQAYMEWPIFKDFRESNDFKAAYVAVFGREPSETQKHESIAADQPAPDDQKA